MSYHNKWKVKHRIACEEEGYPLSEARFSTIDDYIMYLIFYQMDARLIKIALTRFYTEAFNNGFDKREELYNAKRKGK